MGIKSSPTCELTFGATDVPAVGYLVGDVHNGIAQMFTVIEHARMTIGVKAAGTLSTGYLNALAFAKERVQGADLTQMSDKTAPRVTIIHHPDVRRSLMTQKAYAEGLRALYLYAAAHQEDAVAQHVSNADHEMAHRVDDLLLPIVKGVSSERAYEVLTESLQTLGGSGFLQDYPLEQYIRDSKIDSLYEGTTAIQALDFFFRKIVRDRGEALQFVTAQITATIDACDEALKPQAQLLQTALDDVTAMTGALTGYLMSAAQHPTDIYKVGLGSVRYLLAVGDLLIGWRLLVQAGIAHAALAGAAGERRSVLSGQGRDRGVLRQEHAPETHAAAPSHRVHRRRDHAGSRRRVLTAGTYTGQPQLRAGNTHSVGSNHDWRNVDVCRCPTPRLTRFAILAVTGRHRAVHRRMQLVEQIEPDDAPSTSTSTVTSTTTSPAPASGEARVSGLIASVAGNSIQVTKEDNSTAAVNFTSTTKVTETTPAALTDVTSGSCVTVRPAKEAQGWQPVTAASVKVSPSVNGTCPAKGTGSGTGFHHRRRPPVHRRRRPKPAPVRGSVASVSGNTINVTGTDPSGNTTQTAVTVDDKTKYSKQASATTDAIAQGKCLWARGTMDNGGTLQATSINVRQANDGKCGKPEAGRLIAAQGA